MMILTQEKTAIVNIDTAQGIFIGIGIQTREIRARYMDKDVVLGKYGTQEHAEEVLENIFYNAYNGADTYRMPVDKEGT